MYCAQTGLLIFITVAMSLYDWRHVTECRHMLLHSTKALLSLFISRQPLSTTHKWAQSADSIFCMLYTSRYEKPYNSQISIGWVATWAATQCHNMIWSSYVTLVNYRLKLERAFIRPCKTFPTVLSNSVNPSMDMWSLYMVVFLSVLLPGKSC